MGLLMAICPEDGDRIDDISDIADGEVFFKKDIMNILKRQKEWEKTPCFLSFLYEEGYKWQEKHWQRKELM